MIIDDHVVIDGRDRLLLGGSAAAMIIEDHVAIDRRDRLLLRGFAAAGQDTQRRPSAKPA